MDDTIEDVLNKRSISSLDNDEKFGYFANLVVALICAITLIALFLLTAKVTKMVWKSDKIIPVMLCCL